jgi:hypothetical protein
MNYVKWIRVQCVVLVLTLSACATSEVQSHKEENAKITPGQTFQWLTPDVADFLKLHDPHVDYVTSFVHVMQRPEIEGNLRPMVENALIKVGYKLDTGLEPDLYVTFYAKAKDQDWVSSWNGNTPGINDVPIVVSPDYDRELLYRFREGNIYLVLYNRKSKAPVWTGVDMSLRDVKVLKYSDIQTGINRLVTELRKDTSELG